MPVKPLMTWVPGRKGWLKQYAGKSYAVSCRQLGAPPTKDQSVLAANAWWQTKQQELDCQAKSNLPDESWAGIVRGLEAVGKPSTSRQEATESLLAILSRPDLPAGFVEAVLGNRAGAIDASVNAMFGQASPGRELQAHLDTYGSVLRARMNTGQLSVARFAVGQRHLGIFGRWFGLQADVGGLTAPKLEEFWAWLALQSWSNAYKNSIWLETKSFVNRLSELGVIATPGNLRSRRLTFSTSGKKIKTFTDDEIKTCLGCKDRLKLYVLLGLNCAMYQGDMSDLGVDEVDLEKGTLTRPRSKMRNGPVTTYQLWPETIALLRQEKASAVVLNDRGAARWLLSENDTPLVSVRLVDGQPRHYDLIGNVWGRLRPVPKPLKLLRKTGASKLAQHPQFKFYATYYLSHAPSTMAERHYVKPSDAEFAEALNWLRSAWL